jgi:PGF-pre-PGF domain-containing protein
MPVLSQACSSGGVGGPPPESPPSASHSWTRINPGVAISMNINKTGIDFTEISLQVENIANQVSITVTKLAGQPATVTHNVTGKVYQYIEIDRTANINDTNIEEAGIKFKVNKTWINDNNINKSAIALQRYTTIWNKLPTSLVSEDVDYAYYDAETPGFSVFVISGEEIMQICTPNAKQCAGNNLQVCNNEGTAWTIESCEFGCDSATLSCRSEWPPVICTPGEKQCIGNELQICNAEGTAWITETCPYGCENYACKEKAVEVIDYSGAVITIIIIILVLSLLIYYKKEELHKIFKKR